MTETVRPAPWTYLGLAIALLGIPTIVTVARQFGIADNMVVTMRELSIFALTAFVLLIVTRGERRPLSSIGLTFAHPLRSLGHGIVLAIVLLAVVIGLIASLSALGVSYGEGAKIAPTLGITLLTVVRAGICEEVLFRGFAFTRIEELSGSKWLAFAVTLIAFALFHYRAGWAGIAIAGVLGGILTLYFMWKRDLLAAIIAHFLVDFIPNVLLPALGADG